MKQIRLLPLLLALALLFTASVAFADAAADDELSYPHFALTAAGMNLYVAESWHEAAHGQRVFVTSDVKYDEQGKLSSSLVMIAPSELYSADGGIDMSGVLLAIQAFADGIPETDRLGQEVLTSFTTRDIGSANGYTYVYRQNPAPALDAFGDETKAICEAVIASFDEDPTKLVEMTAPPTRAEANSAFGPFSTTDISGTAYGPELFKNAKLTMVDVWATYCSPCLSEMPELAELAKEYADKGVQFVGVVSDAYDEATAELARSIAEQSGVEYVNLVPDIVMSQNRLQYLMYVPTKLFVNADGEEIGEEVVGAVGADSLRATIDALLAQIDAAEQDTAE